MYLLLSCPAHLNHLDAIISTILEDLYLTYEIEIVRVYVYVRL
jgi:hypothetical protein